MKNQIKQLNIFNYSEDIIQQRYSNNNIALINTEVTQSKLMKLKKRFDNFKPDILELLNKNAITSSSLSSNAIERIYTTYTKLHRLATSKENPSNHSEEQVLGYYDAINEINTKSPDLTLENLIYYHKFFDEDGLKQKDNWLEDIRTHQIVFYPASYLVAPDYLNRILNSMQKYNDINDEHYLARVILFNFDFLCIHPFPDGNGRTSRMIFDWMLKPIAPVQYISLEALILQDLQRYYQNLEMDDKTWYEENKAYVTNYGNYICEKLMEFYKLGIDFLESDIWDVDGVKEIYQAIMDLDKDDFELEQLYQIEKIASYKDNIKQVIETFANLKLIGRSKNNKNKFYKFSVLGD